ncbi:MAG: 5-formyltetrahydrofolate cyclo-ligase [Pseudomonadota bacterium]
MSAGARASLMAWRRAERERLIAERLKLPVEYRQQASQRIADRLDAYCRERGLLAPGRIVSGYWPLRGEPDLRPWLARLNQEGIITVLPVVVEKGAPLHFRRWTPGCRMEKGFWNIPVPADPEEFIPEVLLGPVVGFDARRYRLGYGGGYFDRTLALLQQQGRRFHVIGIGLDEARLPAFEALPHDIPFNAIVTPAALIE